MIKKSLLVLAVASFYATAVLAQDAAPAFEKGWRFGLRVTPQPTWYASSEKDNIPAGSKFGIGFGLNAEYRFSKTGALLTGIGGDFEGGIYKFKHDPANNYEATYFMDAEELVKPSIENTGSSYSKYTLKERTVSTTHATIPIILKLSTQEYGGMTYFGMFGTEIGFRLKTQATDSYYTVEKYNPLQQDWSVTETDSKISGIDIGDDAALIPVRIGLNAGLGGEYRLGGSTAFFVSLNYFYSFTNLLRKQSDFVYYRQEAEAFRYIDQNLKMNAIRVNIGLMF